MADFEAAYHITLGHEGGYTKDPVDRGGETYRGIARRYHPSWRGWTIVDNYKTKPNFPQNLNSDENLNKMVKEFYKANYWDVNLLDEFPSQVIAEEVYDTGVNMHPRRAAKFLQIGLNVLNKNAGVYKDISVDGKVGTETLTALNAYLEYRGEEYLYKVLNILQGHHYITYMLEDQAQERFAYGWLNRVDFLKK